MNSFQKLVLGTVQFGCQYGINSAGRPNGGAIREILLEAEKSGIAFLDTSSAYGNAEEVLGVSGIDGFEIISKYPKGNSSVLDSVQESLRRLKKDTLYGYLLHHFDVYRNNPLVWNEFLKLRDKGRVLKIGFSLYQPEELEILLDRNAEFTLLQVPHNIFDRKFDPYLKELHSRGVEVHVRSTFLQGLFFMDRNSLPDRLLPLRPYLMELDRYAEKKGLSVSDIALNFNLQNPYIDGVLIGVDNVQQLKTNVNSISDIFLDIDIDVKEKALLNPVNWK